MSPRTRALLTDLSTWLSAVFGFLSVGWQELLDRFGKLSQPFYTALAQWQIDATLANWTITGLFALAASYFLLSAAARRSLLLRPERFRIKTEDPRHLFGRGKEIDGLAKACADNTLTVLKGESGAGKSALVKAGLCHKLCLSLPRPPGEGRGEGDATPHRLAGFQSPLLPLLIDASGLDWNGGLRRALAQSLAQWPKEQRQLIGDSAPAAPAEKIFERLSKLPEHAPKRLLIILDQIDDYFVAHREHFLHEGVVIKPEALQQANPDWAALAGLLTRKRAHLLLVCRKDEDLLSALHCIEPAYFPLARIEANLISPLLDHITADNGQGLVVQDPQAGWLQLKARLLRDLSEGGQIIPVRLALALDSLRSFRFLTLAHYAKRGGTRGLDRLYVEKHLQNAQHALGLDPAAVLRALALLTEEDGSKTRRIPQAEFTAELVPRRPEDGNALLDLLEQNSLLRRQSGLDGEYLLLYHDYLARGVRDAYQQAN